MYQSRTDLVVLQVSVVDAQRRFVPGLQREDFSVFEEGARQDVVLFASSAAPLDVVLLIDTSGSMASRLGFVQKAAIDLLRTLRIGDRSGLILFNTVVHLAQPLTEDHDRVAQAVRSAYPSGATALHEAVYIALHELSRARRAGGDVRRQALIVLSDGDDNRSRVPFEHVLEEARAGAVTVFTILPGAPAMTNSVWPGFGSPEANVLFQMRRLADDTGGRAFVGPAASDLAAAYDEIANELREQYWLAYAPTALQSGFRRVSVRVHTRPGVQARTRAGYETSRRADALPSGGR
jgi:VWFA-related protein